MQLRVKKLSESAILPTKNLKTDAGFDLYSTENKFVFRQSRATISTSISIEIPEGCVGLIWPRSGLAVKAGIDTLAGVIDHGYTGEIKVCLYNTSKDDYEINVGDKIAQILIQKIEDCEVVEVDTLSESERGDKGFGSSDKKE